MDEYSTAWLTRLRNELCSDSFHWSLELRAGQMSMLYSNGDGCCLFCHDNTFNPFCRMGYPKIDLLTCIFFIRLFRLLDNEVDYLFFERAKIFIKIALCAKGASYFSILCYCCLFFQLVRRVTTF